MINTITLIIGMTFLYATPLIFGAMGGVVSERSGVINIGIEGMMTIGAFVAATVSYYLGDPWIALLAALIAGGVFSLLHAIASITFQADQTISGIALNLIGPGIAFFLCRIFFDGSIMTKPSENVLPNIFGSGVDGIYGNLNLDVSFFIALAATIITWFMLYKTKWGLRVRAVGEHPAAADTLGVNVYRIRYICVIISGMLAGVGGAGITLGIVSQFNPTVVAGQGFIALAAVIFGKWKPWGAFGACLVFGLAQALVVVFDDKSPIPSEFMAMFPYILTIIILVLFVGKSVAPKADGVPYEKGNR